MKKNKIRKQNKNIIMKRVMSLILCITCITISITLPNYTLNVNAAEKKAEIATWEGWRKCAVSFNFNQGAPSHCNDVAPIFENYGYRASFYLVTNWNPNWNKFQELADKGHEIGSNSKTSPNNMYNEENSSKEEINNIIKSKYGCITVAYPHGNLPNVDKVKENYIAGCKMVVGTSAIMSKDGPNDWTEVLSYLTGSDSDINSESDFIDLISNTYDKEGWVTFTTFGLAGKNNGNATFSPTDLSAIKSTLKWISDRDSKIWVAPLCNVAMYIKERNASTFTLKESNIHGDVYSLTHKIADSICEYDYPLSVKVPIPCAGAPVKVTQNGENIDFEVKDDGMVYFSAVPNGGDIVIVNTECKDYIHNVETQNATCEEDGVNEYYICDKCEKKYTDSSCKNEIIDFDAYKSGDGKIAKLGHKYDQPIFTWTGFTTAKATFTCINDPNHKKNIDATITNKVIKEATTTEEGTKAYIATVEFEGNTYTDTKDETIPKLEDPNKSDPDSEDPNKPNPDNPSPIPPENIKFIIISRQESDIKDKFDISTLAEGEEIAGYYIKDKKEKKLALVNKKGILTPKKPGVIHVTAYKKDGKTKAEVSTIELKILAPAFDKKAMTATYAGQTVKADALLSDFAAAAYGQTVTWKSSKTKVATVDETSGLITAIKSGKTTILVKFTNKEDKSVTVKAIFTVKIPKLNVKDTLSLKAGKLKKLSVVNIGKDDVVTWQSSNPSIVSIDPNGKKAVIKALATGSSEITASVNGHSYKVTVTVP